MCERCVKNAEYLNASPERRAALDGWFREDVRDAFLVALESIKNALSSNESLLDGEEHTNGYVSTLMLVLDSAVTYNADFLSDQHLEDLSTMLLRTLLDGSTFKYTDALVINRADKTVTVDTNASIWVESPRWTQVLLEFIAAWLTRNKDAKGTEIWHLPVDDAHAAASNPSETSGDVSEQEIAAIFQKLLSAMFPQP